MANHAGHVYELVGRLIEGCRKVGRDDLAVRLADALTVSSSSLEVLGSLKKIIVDERRVFEQFALPHELEEVVRYVDRVYGAGPE